MLTFFYVYLFIYLFIYIILFFFFFFFFFEKINSLNKNEKIISSNEIYLADINYFFENFKNINKQNIVFISKISTNWNTETVEINKNFKFINFFKLMSLKYKINNQLGNKEISVYSNKNNEFLINTLYKLVLILAFI